MPGFQVCGVLTFPCYIKRLSLFFAFPGSAMVMVLKGVYKH